MTRDYIREAPEVLARPLDLPDPTSYNPGAGWRESHGGSAGDKSICDVRGCATANGTYRRIEK